MIRKKIAFIIPIFWGIIFAAQIIEVNGSETELKMQQINPFLLNVSFTTGDLVSFTDLQIN